MEKQTSLRIPRGRPLEFDMDTAVEHAMEVFWPCRYHNTSLCDLFEATNLSRGSLYATFGDKRGLFLRALFLGGLNCALTFIGRALGRAGMLAVAQQLSTPFTMLLAWSFLGERPSPRVILGLVVAFGGVALSSAGSDASVRQLAILLIISGGLAMAIRNVLTERHGPYEPLNLLGGCRRC